MKEYNLSEEGQRINLLEYYREDKVKEFIKRRNRLDSDLRNNRITWSKYLDERGKLAGDKLR